MKTFLMLATVISAVLFTAPTAEARPGHGHRYVSGHTSCGCPIYKQRYVAYYDSCGHPVYRYRSVPVRHHCRAARSPRYHHGSRIHRSHSRRHHGVRIGPFSIHRSAGHHSRCR